MHLQISISGRTPLHVAAGEGNIPDMKQVVKDGVTEYK